MKTRNTENKFRSRLALCASLLACAPTLSANAANSNFSARLPVQEKFEFAKSATELKNINNFHWENYKLIPGFGSTYDCDDREINGTFFRSDIAFPFMDWIDVSVDIPLQSSFFQYEEHFFKSNRCYVNERQLTPDHVLPYFTFEDGKNNNGQYTSELNLERLSPDGSFFEASYRLKGDFLKNVLVSGHDELVARFGLTLHYCVTEDGQGISGNELHGRMRGESIRDLIASFRATPVRNFVQCHLQVMNDGRIRPELSRIGRFEYNSHTGYERFSRFDHFTIQAGVESLYQVDSQGTVVDEIKRSVSNIDPSAESTIREATESFIGWLKSDYVDFLDQLNSRSPGENERNQAVRAFAQQNKARIIGWLSTIDQNLPSILLMSKVSVLMNINQAYLSVSQIERQAMISEGILDRVIRRNAQ